MQTQRSNDTSLGFKQSCGLLFGQRLVYLKELKTRQENEIDKYSLIKMIVDLNDAQRLFLFPLHTFSDKGEQMLDWHADN